MAQENSTQPVIFRVLWNINIQPADFLCILEALLKYLLNEVWTDIPKEDQLQPIFVAIPMFRWFERLFLVKIQKNLINDLENKQTGFVTDIGKSLNILLLW